jgi:hypothetical protein
MGMRYPYTYLLGGIRGSLVDIHDCHHELHLLMVKKSTCKAVSVETKAQGDFSVIFSIRIWLSSWGKTHKCVLPLLGLQDI